MNVYAGPSHREICVHIHMHTREQILPEAHPALGGGTFWATLPVDFHLSLLKRSKAIPADQGSHSALLGLPRSCHPGAQALHGRTVNLLQPGLDGRLPAGAEAVRAQVQRESLRRGKNKPSFGARTEPGSSEEHSIP